MVMSQILLYGAEPHNVFYNVFGGVCLFFNKFTKNV